MFRFKTSFKKKGYHIHENDPPFVFPPKGVQNEISGNLVQIYGPNGTGKTTLLNILALSFGYFENEEELRNKPKLKETLKELKENETLEYYFKITQSNNNTFDLIIEKKANESQTIILNNQYKTMDFIRQTFEVLYLTEDNPEKIINITTEKLTSNFQSLLDKLNSFENFVFDINYKIREYEIINQEITKFEDDINKKKETLKKLKSSLSEIEEKLRKINRKRELDEKLRILEQSEEIEKNFKKYENQYLKLSSQTNDKKIEDKINHNIYQQKKLREELENIKNEIETILDELKLLNINLDRSKLYSGDTEEINALLNKYYSKINDVSYIQSRIAFASSLISFLGNYPPSLHLPVIEKTNQDLISELDSFVNKHKNLDPSPIIQKLGSILALSNEYFGCEAKLEKLRKDQKELENTNKDAQKLSAIKIQYEEALELYSTLNKIKKESTKESLLEEYASLRVVKIEEENELSEKKQQKKNEVGLLDQSIKNKEYILNLKKEQRGLKPQFFDDKEKIKELSTLIANIKKKLEFWKSISQNPSKVKSELKDVNDQQEFDRFRDAVGLFFAESFEPLPFDQRYHEVKFFDIDKKIFITKEDRCIKMSDLSQAQTKTTSLNSGLAQIKPYKKAIVLIDEVADLDKNNLDHVKSTLKKKFLDGSVFLAVLVRPPLEKNPNDIVIECWD